MKLIIIEDWLKIKLTPNLLVPKTKIPVKDQPKMLLQKMMGRKQMLNQHNKILKWYPLPEMRIQLLNKMDRQHLINQVQQQFQRILILLPVTVLLKMVKLLLRKQSLLVGIAQKLIKVETLLPPKQMIKQKIPLLHQVLKQTVRIALLDKDQAQDQMILKMLHQL